MKRFSGAAAVLSLLVLGLVGPLSGPGAAATVSRARGWAAHEVVVFGHTVKGRPLVAYRVGDADSPTKVVVLAAMHGDETGPSRILRNLIHGAPVHGADIWLIPTLNRDGRARHTRQNARGVDLNRNFPVHWVRRTGHYSSGRKPASEPETRALMRFLTQVRPTSVISFHQPLHGVDTSYGKARPLARRLVRGLHLPAKVFHCTSGCHGTMTEWFNARFPGAALTVEYGPRVSRHQVRVTGPRGILAAVGARR